jgi:signal transduction histidine kinase
MWATRSSRIRACAADLGGWPRRSRRRSGKAEEEADTVVVSATTTTQPVGVWASRAPSKIRGTGPDPYENSRPLVPLWAAFAAVNVWLMFLFPGGETIPFHLVWLSLALVYGLAPWRQRTMIIALAVVGVVTFWALLHHVQAGYIGLEETTEVPLMSAIFLAMVWHVKRRQAALQEVERLAAIDRSRAETQQQFVRLASHEMRTPITVVRGYTELIRSAHADPQTIEDAEIVLDELDKLDRSTRRLVTLIGLTASSANIPVDLDQLLEHTARRWMLAAARDWHVDSTAGTMTVDVERLQTALDCLLENAIKYSDVGDAIALRGRRSDGWIEIDVTDGGRGIPPGEFDRIFEIATRGSNAGDRGGTGLGLSIVHRVVQERGGTVSVRSGLGVGTTFTLRLPATVPAGPPRPRNSAEDAYIRSDG